MDKKLLIVITGLVIIAMATAPVLAATPAVNPLDQILTIVKDIQKKMQTPPEPIRYEYYTQRIDSGENPELLGYYAGEMVTNWGNTDAEVCWTTYQKFPTQPWEVQESCINLPAGETVQCGPTIALHSHAIFKFKLTTNSKYVVPSGRYVLLDGTIIHDYLPGDFQKVEIYS